MRHHIMENLPLPGGPDPDFGHGRRVVLACGAMGRAFPASFSRKYFDDATQVDGWCPMCAAYLRRDDRFPPGDLIASAPPWGPEA